MIFISVPSCVKYYIWAKIIIYYSAYVLRLRFQNTLALPILQVNIYVLQTTCFLKISISQIPFLRLISRVKSNVPFLFKFCGCKLPFLLLNTLLYRIRNFFSSSWSKVTFVQRGRYSLIYLRSISHNTSNGSLLSEKSYFAYKNINYEAKDNLIFRLTLQKESSVIVSQSTFAWILKSDSK